MKIKCLCLSLVVLIRKIIVVKNTAASKSPSIATIASIQTITKTAKDSCPMCDFKSSNKTLFNRHLQSHEPKVPD